MPTSGCSWTSSRATRPCSCAATRSRRRGPGSSRSSPRWATSPDQPQRYPAGTSGPIAATTLIERDGRSWHGGPTSDHCTSTPSSPRSPRASSSAAPPAATAYLGRIRAAGDRGPARGRLGLRQPRPRLRRLRRAGQAAPCAARAKPNVAIVSAYNDMLSAHQPFETYPGRAQAGRDPRRGGIAQFAGGVPAMCDGITQGRDGHAALALQPRRDRDVDRDRAVARHVRRRADARRLRQDRAGPADRRALLRPPADASSCRPARWPRACRTARRARSASCTPRARSAARSCSRPRPRRTTRPGTCTFYGTANSNQLLMEVMGLHLPGSRSSTPARRCARR